MVAALDKGLTKDLLHHVSAQSFRLSMKIALAPLHEMLQFL